MISSSTCLSVSVTRSTADDLVSMCFSSRKASLISCIEQQTEEDVLMQSDIVEQLNRPK